MSIKELREKEKLSQSRFAKKYGISTRTLQQWEQERSAPPCYLEGLLKMAQPAEVLRLKTNTTKPFRICIKDPFVNCSKIYPIQQKKVRAILDAVKDDPNVKKVMIFGSSTQYSCTIDSDVDVFIELKKNSPIDISGISYEFDLWTNYNVDERLLKEIEKTGVKVYG